MLLVVWWTNYTANVKRNNKDVLSRGSSLESVTSRGKGDSLGIPLRFYILNPDGLTLFLAVTRKFC